MSDRWEAENKQLRETQDIQITIARNALDEYERGSPSATATEMADALRLALSAYEGAVESERARCLQMCHNARAELPKGRPVSLHTYFEAIDVCMRNIHHGENDGAPL